MQNGPARCELIKPDAMCVNGRVFNRLDGLARENIVRETAILYMPFGGAARRPERRGGAMMVK